ncbi:hypothetical protein [Tychonema sp. LEGE 07203]|uniref:hypothetical protein n=1 Tax=Tychonema sp. LEGE 07203 TaxID=1828671 RepID=UPI00187FF30F|nr:hypothetical protein [Tychonema sp. LEGE 07203]MBE9093801.1 hypothetical protein [Tychonema sp. LEGE 07203]
MNFFRNWGAGAAGKFLPSRVDRNRGNQKVTYPLYDPAVETRFAQTFVGPKADWLIKGISCCGI